MVIVGVEEYVKNREVGHQLAHQRPGLFPLFGKQAFGGGVGFHPAPAFVLQQPDAFLIAFGGEKLLDRLVVEECKLVCADACDRIGI